MVIILFVGAEAAGNIPLFPAPLDKVAHFVYYGVMAALVAHAIGLRWLWLAVVLVVLIGVVDEWNQSIVAGRDASPWDWIADAMGAVIFVYGYWKWATKKSIEDRP